MGWRFFKRLKILPGLWLNMSKSGPSVSVGVRGLRATFRPGRTRLTGGLPGTGLSYTRELRENGHGDENQGRRLLNKALRGE